MAAVYSPECPVSPDLDTPPGQLTTDTGLTSSQGGWPGPRTLHCTGDYILMFYFVKKVNIMKYGDIYTSIPLGKCFPKLHIAHYDQITSQES